MHDLTISKQGRGDLLEAALTLKSIFKLRMTVIVTSARYRKKIPFQAAMVVVECINSAVLNAD